MSNFFDDDDFFSDKKSRNSSSDFDFSDQKNDDPFSFGDDSGWGGGSNEPPSGSDGLPTPPKWAWIAFGVVAALVVGGLGIGSLLNRGSEVVEPSPSPTVTESESPSPSPTPSETVDVDPYAQPKDLETFIASMSASTVNVSCETAGGTGWAIDIADAVATSGVTSIITNHHVIEECTGGYPVYISELGSENWIEVELIDWDIDADVALLETTEYIPALPTAKGSTAPKVGHWVMAIGSPGSAMGVLEGAVTTGNITNIQDMWIISDTTINPGNSGGPLINAWGQVVGTNTAVDISENVSNVFYAGKAEYMCSFFVECE